MTNSYNYIKNVTGIMDEVSYPYVNINTTSLNKCSFNADKVSAKIKKFVRIPKNNEAALKKAVATIGPVAAGKYQ